MENNNKISDFYLHSSSNVFSVNALNTICGNPVEKSKLREASFYDLFNTPALVEKICSDDIISPICDSYKDVCDISNKPTESIRFKIPMKIVDRVMSNCYLGDGTVHPGDHLLFIDELCKLFKWAGISMDQVKRKLFSLSLKGRAAEWYKMLKNCRSICWEEIVPLFYYKFYPPSEIHKDRNQIYNFWPEDEESIAQSWRRFKSLMLKCPVHELPNNILINNFYARLSLHNKDLLDASCSGSFTRMKEESKWDLLDRIQENTEAWENDKGRKSGMNYDYECTKYFMGTDDFCDISTEYGL